MTAPAAQLRQMLRLREQRERRARAELEHRTARQTAANAAAKSAASRLSAQTILRKDHEAQIYCEMLGHTLTPRDIDRVVSRLSTLKAQVARAAADADAASDVAAAAGDAVDEARRGFSKLLQARRKWEHLIARAEQAGQRRAALVEEMATADLRLARAAP
jgi:Type III secretion protein YscO